MAVPYYLRRSGKVNELSANVVFESTWFVSVARASLFQKSFHFEATRVT